MTGTTLNVEDAVDIVQAGAIPNSTHDQITSFVILAHL